MPSTRNCTDGEIRGRVAVRDYSYRHNDDDGGGLRSVVRIFVDELQECFTRYSTTYSYSATLKQSKFMVIVIWWKCHNLCRPNIVLDFSIISQRISLRSDSTFDLEI